MRLAVLFFWLFVPVFAISASADLGPLFDRYSTRISFKQEKERLDNYAIQVRNTPHSRALLVVYAKDDDTAKAAKARARRAVNYLVKTRGLSQSIVSWRYEGACAHDGTILLYLLEQRDAVPVPDIKCLRA